jgi:ATP-dependent Clp protease adaptor protein ClpS
VTGCPNMSDIDTRSTTKDELKVERPRLHKVILVNDDYTPREFVVMVLKAEFRVSEDQAMRVMITAHRRGACVVAVYTEVFTCVALNDESFLWVGFVSL